MSACFEYGQKEIEYLKSKDKKLAACIERIGHIERAVDTDLFSSVVHHIIGQQISTKAQATIWQRMQDSFGEVTAETIGKADITRLQSFGMTFRKAEYIQDFARKVESGSFDLNTVENLPDEQAIQALASLKGIGVWTAEMILLFCLQRPNVFSYGKLLSKSEWKDEESVAQWRNLLAHRLCQKHGRENDFVDYKITVVTPIRCYTMTERSDAPADSNEYFGG